MAKRFSDRAAGAKAKRQWLCDVCGFAYDHKVELCESCGSANIEYFQSKSELRRWINLQLMQKVGEISELERQIVFLLAGKFGTIRTPTGRTMTHTVDFKYTENGQTVYEDSKGLDTDLGHMKRELVRALYGYEIRIY